ncbi:MAG: shikimate dehydrogenase [Actinomycetales bacterium]|nr:shikimate dehydrogenase [Actinomycetales bacterium]
MPRRAAVLGLPVSHSLSPVMHRAAYAALGLDWAYDAIEVDEAGLAPFLDSLDESWAGLSLTMPLKEAVIDLLAEVEPTARTLASVNTVLPASGGWRGTNTDVYGMVQALREAGLGPGPATGLILGAGATARSALAALAGLGVAEVLLSARRAEAARGLLPLAEAVGVRATVIDWASGSGATPEAVAAVQVTVSTVPGDAGVAWLDHARRSTGALLDASYHPWPTPLAAAWKGDVIASGRAMLLWQAVEQVRLMTGMDAPVEAMRASLPAA